MKADAKDGVNIEEESSFSSFAGSICKASYENSPFVEVHDLSGGNFRGPRPFTIKNLPKDCMIEASTDGIGTKGIIIDAAKTHHLAAYDIIAMTASDITRFGGVPLVFINVFDTSSVGNTGDEVRQAYKSAIEGMGKVVKEARIVALKGETAQMGVAIGSEITDSKTKLNWSGTMIGAYHKDKMITGDTLNAGQVIIALKENGFRCNGISSVRSALREKFGERWFENENAKESIMQAATPSVLYDTFVNTIHGWFNSDLKAELTIHAVVHLSGGAFKEKLAKDILFPRGLSADISDLWEPPQIMRNCGEWRNLTDEEFYEVWNGGQGMLLVVNKEDADLCIKRASDFSIQAKIIGTITKEVSPQISINSKFNIGNKVIYK
ncbi:MAG: Phosphoribosylformylglycinamidine cyclo-ligase [Patescibacteria group bacterium]|nr:Phosphoribosylformylglycinamidine cyclo-ligase [Patescibacteria group bacterium]